MADKSVPDYGDETIVAIITPPGTGGIAALRISGRRSLAILNKHFKSATDTARPFLMRYGNFVTSANDPIDEVMAVYMPAGKSYTGLDQVEIFCHGGSQVASVILTEIVRAGARVAEPGEFTKLAFLSGRIDLSRAEAVAEIIAANCDRSYKAAKEHLLGGYSDHIERLRKQLIGIIAEGEAGIDFPEEEIDAAELKKLNEGIKELRKQVSDLADSFRGGRILTEGFKIAIAGRTNAGKSSLFNRLLRHQRAIVNPMAGTTRDYLSEWIDLEGYAVNIVDTAGLRRSGGSVEKSGQASARKIIAESDLVLWIADCNSKGWEEQAINDTKRLSYKKITIVANKIDLLAGNPSVSLSMRNNQALPAPVSVSVSCLTGKGIKSLQRKLVELIETDMPDLTAGLVVTSKRHQQKLNRAKKHLESAGRKIKLGESPELAAFDLRLAGSELDEITGKVYNEEILAQIFSKFCVGK